MECLKVIQPAIANKAVFPIGESTEIGSVKVNGYFENVGFLAACRSKRNFARSRSQILPGSDVVEALPQFRREAEPPHAPSQAEPEEREHAPTSC
jgi:hypothetical protein